MSNIKIKNVSVCAKCAKNNNCAQQKDYTEFVEKVSTIADSYNSINGKMSIKCKKEC